MIAATPFPLELVRTFVLVAAHQSFARCARELRITPSAVSRQIQSLERHLGSQLFYRTTRTMTLTEAGRTYLRSAREALESLDRAGLAVSRLRDEVTGTLRLSAPVAFGRRFVVPAVASFAARHPRLSLELEMTDEHVDLVAQAVDLAVRVGRLADSSLRSRKLASNRRLLVASPAYLARRGVPAAAADLRGHSCIALTVNRDGEQWRLTSEDGQVTSIKPRGELRANNGDAVLEFARSGCGIAFVSQMLAEDDLAAGSLVRVLSKYSGPDTGVHAVFRAEPKQNAAVRALVDHLVANFVRDTAPSNPWSGFSLMPHAGFVTP